VLSNFVDLSAFGPSTNLLEKKKPITIDCASEIASIAIIDTVKIFPSLSTTRSDQFLGCSSELSRARQKGATRDVVTAAAATTTTENLSICLLSLPKSGKKKEPKYAGRAAFKTEKTSNLRRRVYANFSPEEFEKLKERSFRTPPPTPPRLPRKPCARPSTSRQQDVGHGTEIPPWNGPADSNNHDYDTYQIPIYFPYFIFFEIVIIHNLI
jgi:hypothetical protein